MSQPQYAVNKETGKVLRNDGSGWQPVQSARNAEGVILINEGSGWNEVPTQPSVPTDTRESPFGVTIARQEVGPSLPQGPQVSRYTKQQEDLYGTQFGMTQSLSQLDRDIGSLNDELAARMEYEQAQLARATGKPHWVTRLPDGTPVRQSASNVDAMLAGEAQTRAEREKARQDRILQGRVSAGVNAATFGFGDEIYQALGDDFVANRYRDTLQEARQERPLETLGIEVIGSIPTGMAAARGGSALMTRAGMRPLGAGQSAALGGAVYGLGDANGGIEDRTVGALTGGAGGLLLAKGAQGGLSIGGALRRNQQAPGLVAKDEFGIRLTRGQATGDADQIAFEQAAARGGRSNEAQQVMRPFMEDQREAVRVAGRGLAGDQFTTANEAGAFVAEGLKRRAGDAQAEIDRLYDEASSYGAKMAVEGVEAMPDAIRASLPENITFTLQSAPEEAARAMPETLRALAAVDRLKTSLPEAPQSAPREGLDFRRIEIARQAINDAVGDAVKPSDVRGAMAVKRAFDAYLDGAVDAALFEGDTAFLDAYKAARGARAEFARNFEANKVFEKLVAKDASPEQTLEYILGANKIAPTERVRTVVPQLKEALGADSPEWAALQEAAIKRVMGQTDRTYNPKVLRDNLDELLVGRNQTVAEELFTPDQYARLRRFRSVVDRLVPPEGTVNTSNTAYEIQRALRQEAASLFNAPGSRTIGAMVSKYLPDRDASRARSAISEFAGGARPAPRIPNAFASTTAVGGTQLPELIGRNAFGVSPPPMTQEREPRRNAFDNTTR